MPTQPTQSLLLIDDSPEDRGRIRSALIKGAPDKRFRFLEAENGLQGLELFESNQHVQCVIVDIHMPRMNGIDFLKNFTDASGAPRCPVIVLTGSSGKSEPADALRFGAQDYVSKDAVFPEVLPRVVDNAIERFRLHQQLVQSQIAADTANRSKSAMIGNISHEIRTPMTAILGLTELLLESDLSNQQKEMLEMVKDNSQYLVEIVNDLLDMSKMEAGMLEIEPTRVNLRRLLEEIVQLMSVRAKTAGNSLELFIGDDLPSWSLVDPIRLRQVLLNLMSNAIKFTDNGTVELEAKSLIVDEKIHLEFQVRDSGCGIAEAEHLLIFEPFVQVGQTRTRKVGTGLGLSICKRLVTGMGGRIAVSSQPKKGSTFTITVPHTEPSDDIDDSLLEVERSLTEIAPDALANCNIIAAEDTRATQVLLKLFIGGFGGQAMIVDDGRKLVDRVMASPGHFDLIITDYQMPNLNGLDAVKELRASGIESPIVVLTADALEQTRLDAIEAGANEVVTKPIERRRLIDTLVRLRS